MNSIIKSTTIVLILTCSFNHAMAQHNDSPFSASNTFENATGNLEGKASDSSGINFYSLHLQSATKQVQHHLSKNMMYPDDMKKYNIEGKVVVEISISKTGEIMKVSIHESLHTEFDKLALDAISKMKKIELNETKYHGPRRILFPIQFNLK